MAMRILVLNGPNLNLLGERDPAHYGKESFSYIQARMEERANEYGWEIDFRQSNHEGQLIDWLHEARLEYDAVIFNAGAYSHYSYAIRDAIEAIRIPVVEVHLSNIHAREEFRHTSVISAVCRGSISGFGAASYVIAMEALAETIEE